MEVYIKKPIYGIQLTKYNEGICERLATYTAYMSAPHQECKYPTFHALKL